MSRIVVLNLGSHGHVNPTLAMTQALVSRGHEVSYFCTAEFSKAIGLTGAKFGGYESIFTTNAPKVQDLPEMMATFPVRLYGEAVHVLPQVMPQIRELDPEIVIYDPMCIAGRLAAEALKVPAVTVHPTYAANQHFSLRRNFGRAQFSDKVVADFEKLAASVAKDFNIAPTPLASLFEHAEGLNIVFMPRSFHPQSETFDDRFQFVGPGFTSRPDTGNWSPSAVPRERRMFISMGTVFNDWPEFFKMSLDAFAGSQWEVLMAVGKRVDPSKLGPLPSNITASEYLPQLDILPHTAVAIMHGGMGTTMEALSNGVPLVVIPQMQEQMMTASRVAELGLGLHLDRKDVTPALLIEAAEKVANDSQIKSNVKVLQKQLENGPGYLKAVMAIEAYL